MSLTDFATAKTNACGAVVLRSSHDCALLLPCIRVEEILSVYRGRTKCTIYLHFGVAICNTRNAVRSAIKFDLNCSAYSQKFQSACSDLLWDSLGRDLDGDGNAVKLVKGNEAQMAALGVESEAALRTLDEQRQARVAVRFEKIKTAADARKAKKQKSAADEALAMAGGHDADAAADEEEEVEAEEEREYSEYELEQIRLAEETDAAIREDNAKNSINSSE